MTNVTATDRKTLINAHRDAPEGMMFYASIGELRKDSSLAPYWLAMDRAWRALNLNGILCVEGVPTLYLSVRNQRVNAEEAAKLHCSFWNHGLATVYVLVDTTQVRIFSATAKPGQAISEDGQLAGLVETMDRTRYALQLHSFLLQLGTGAYYRAHGQKFDPDAAVDAFLIHNLRTLRNELISVKCGLPVETAHVFLARLLFVAYLTDRGIINLPELAGLKTVFGPNLGNMLARLTTVTTKREALLRIFQTLRDQFNGNMFEAATLTECRRLNEEALRQVSDFFNGHDLGRGQYTLNFWAYDFSMIPVEVISAVYEDFLKIEDQPGKRSLGAYYTPRFLAETVIDLAVRDCASLQEKSFLDPSCGSGIFLVTLFNRLAGTWMLEHPKAGYSQKADALKSILRDQIRGVDKNPTACRIACFSLYLAFLDCFAPPDINQYIARKGKLPNILRFHPDQCKPEPEIPVIHEDDFLKPAGKIPRDMDFLVGNPPWADRGAVKGLHHQFARRIPAHLKKHGIASVLLPSKTFLNEKTNAFQAEWIREISLEEVIQLADYRKILFEEANCPCMIVRFRNDPMVEPHDKVEYVVPKVTRTSAREGLVPVAPTDRKSISIQRLLHAARHQAAPVIWKNHLWGSPRDIKFLELLEDFPKLGGARGKTGRKKTLG